MTHSILERKYWRSYATNSRRVASSFTIAALVLSLVSLPSMPRSARAVAVSPAPNPTLPQSCGLDVALVLDSSGSIDSTELGQMKAAFKGFVDALLPATPTQFSVTEFDTTAVVQQTFTDNATLAKNAIDGAVSGGATNWEDGLTKGWSTYDPRPNPNLVIFASDGNPNRKGTVFPIVAGEAQAVAAAVTVADTIKNAGTRIITLGIGNNLDVANLTAISSADAVYTSGFDTLAADLAELADELCGGTITVTKIIDRDGNLQDAGDQIPAQGWTFDVAGESKVTDVNGQTMPKEVDQGTYSVTETVQQGYDLVGAVCTGATDNGSWNGNAVTGIEVGQDDFVSCTFYNSPLPTLTVYKTVVPSEGPYDLSAGNFSIHVKDGSQQDVNGSPAPGNKSGTPYTLPPGDYFVSEDSEEGYTADFTSCHGSEGYYSLNYGDAGVCSIVNTENEPPTTGTLVVTKVVVNDNGGTMQASDFPITVTPNGGNPINWTDMQAADGGLSIVYTYSALQPGSFYVEEAANSGYTDDFSQCGSDGILEVVAGQVTQCTITNDDKSGTLTVIKVLEGSGQLNYSDFSFEVNGGDPITFDTDGQNELTVNAGIYTVVEPAVENYGTEYSNCDQVSVPNGGSVTCTITNTYEPPIVTGTIEVCKYEDTDGDGEIDTPLVTFVEKVKRLFINAAYANGYANPLSGWTINITDGAKFSDSKETGKDGCVQFTDLPYATYTISEEMQPGWVRTMPEANSIVINLDVSYNWAYFLNHQVPPEQTGSIHGYKWNDQNGDGEYGEEGLMSGWRIFIDENDDGEWDEGETYMDTSDSEGHYGWYWFENLPYGTYVICEVQQNGWTQTYPVHGCHEVTLPNDDLLTPNAVYAPEYNFGNHYTGNEESDVCPNLEGVQTEVPSGYTLVEGQCIQQSSGGGGGGGGTGLQLIITNEQLLPEVSGDSLTATITWTTNHPATSRVVWDTVSHPYVGSPTMYGYAFTNTEDPTLVVFHSMTITGLIAGQTYYFRPISHGSPEVNGIELAYTPPGGGGTGPGGAVAGESTGPTPQVLGATDTTLPRTGGLPLEGMFYLSWLAPLLERFRVSKMSKNVKGRR